MSLPNVRLTRRPTVVATETGEREAQLLFIDERLAAILVRNADASTWTLAAVFGVPLERGATFPSLEDVERRVVTGAAGRRPA